MKFYHGTSQANWEKIQKEGVLWGMRDCPSRCTYLATNKNEAMCYGEVVLEVEYEPYGTVDNYCKGCWQVRVYAPILLKNICQIRSKE